jgi:hypothetical protein
MADSGARNLLRFGILSIWGLINGDEIPNDTPFVHHNDYWDWMNILLHIAFVIQGHVPEKYLLFFVQGPSKLFIGVNGQLLMPFTIYILMESLCRSIQEGQEFA